MHRPVDAGPRTAGAGGGSGVLSPATDVGVVRLTASDLARVQAFYEQVLGLAASEDDGHVVLRAGGGPPLVELHPEGDAQARDVRSPGLFHLAVLMPDRQALATALARVAAARWPLSGASDHLVSEALYLSDPEGNGIEIYRDRPRDEWEVRDGQLAMATLPLDLDDLVRELDGAPDVEAKAPSGAKMGHVHLQVSDLGPAEEFYAGVLGFDVTVRGYPGALFVSAGGYHHHLGLNTWNSAGSPPAPPGVTGLRSFDVVLPTEDEVQKVVDRARAAGIAVQPEGGGQLVRDPFGNGVLLRAS